MNDWQARGCVASAVLVAIGLSSGCATGGLQSSCEGGLARPLGVRTVVSGLRSHGVHVFRSPSNDVLCGRGVVAVVSNTQFAGAHRNISDHRGILAREGQVDCVIERSPSYSSKVAGFRYDGGRRIVFDPANVECSLHPDGSRSSTQVQNLRDSMSVLRTKLPR